MVSEEVIYFDVGVTFRQRARVVITLRTQTVFYDIRFITGRVHLLFFTFRHVVLSPSPYCEITRYVTLDCGFRRLMSLQSQTYSSHNFHAECFKCVAVYASVT
jgi:hypothetical protein